MLGQMVVESGIWFTIQLQYFLTNIHVHAVAWRLAAGCRCAHSIAFAILFATKPSFPA